MNTRFNQAWLGAVALTLGACSAQHSEEVVSRNTAALSSVPASCVNRLCTASVVVPSGASLRDFTLLGSSSVKLDPRAQVLAADGSPGALAALGNIGVDVGNSARVGAISAIGNVLVEGSARVTGPLSTSGSAQLQAGAVVTGALLQHAALATSSVALDSLTLPTAFHAAVDLEPGNTAVLPPLAYDGLAVKSRSQATIQAGQYIFGDFSLEPAATLAIQNANGAVVIHVLNHFACKGTWSPQADSANVKIVYWGTDSISIECSLGAASFVAPFASVRAADRTNVAQIIGKDVELGVDATAKSRLFHSLTTGPGSAPLTGLTAADLRTSCQQVDAFNGANARELGCRFAGLTAVHIAKPATDADVRSVCQTAYDACIADPCAKQNPFPGPCSATVDDWDACIEAWAPRLSASYANIPACAAQSLYGAFTYRSAAPPVFPAECQAINACAGLSYH